ncbi:hypothetical protein GLW08_06045 [Pontibacillus yanchengensis]|uniref:Uncharacterized protein n=2 Tax=Pontibacillus yanchengensis TaxID=462910 RepID=A0A6I4ZVF6_9BACI|nr:CBO0543 family protein [Pontibacillus yanchengensis]MYL32317.1 hypothetical protein [Pontibacillus yanchengensis]MYL52897.1 hypothetical protein [Pontibacillus yanchengensis]
MDQQTYLEKNLEFYEKLTNMAKSKIPFWYENVLFTPHWWAGLALSTAPWIVWFLLSKKESRDRLLYSGFLVILLSSFLDFLGVKFGLWVYHYGLFPWIPAYAPWDCSLIPVIIMGLIEYKPHVSPLLKGLIYAFLTSFIGESISKYFHLYEELQWSSFYSFPIFFLIYLIAHWASLRTNYSHYRH